ncbi:hypothetical protein QBC34DRAFT_295972, partial [Podospora aff. communis PSN243]
YPNPRTSNHHPSLHQLLGSSPNYNGDLFNTRNISADIPDTENCSLCLTGLPPDVTYAQLLALFRGTGRIFATYINPPQLDRGHPTCAAKVTFFSKDVAQGVIRRHGPGHAHHQGLSIGRYRISVFRNRTKVSERQTTGSNWEYEDGGLPSRVHIVSGPRGVVRLPAVFNVIRTGCYFELDGVVAIADTEESCAFEIRFASFYGTGAVGVFYSAES